MKFSTRSTYGLRAMIRLAKNYKQGSTPLSSIAKKEKISQGYLGRLFGQLKRANLITAEKGVSGGYCLVKNPKAIPVYDIIKALEGKMSSFHCLSEAGKVYCDDKCDCGATKVLVKVQRAVSTTLKGIKLGDLA